MITLKIKNAPSGAKSWIPVYFPAGGGAVSPDSSLSLTTSYGMNIGMGAGVNFIDLSFIVYSNNPGAGWNDLSTKDLYSQQVVDGRTYTFNWSTGQLEDNSSPPPDPEFRNLQIYDWTNSVKVGNNCKLYISFEYRGPAITQQLHAAIGKDIGYFDETLANEITLQLSNTPNWLKYYTSITIPLTSAISPGAYDLYCKLNGLIPTIISPYLYDAVTVESGYPSAAWRNVKILDHSTQVQYGQSVVLKVQYQYQGPGGQAVLYGAVGNVIAGIFDEVISEDVTITMPPAVSWVTREAQILIPVANGTISPGIYDAYAKVQNSISPYLNNVIEIMSPAAPEVRSLAVTSATSPVKIGSTCWIDFRFEYKGPTASLAVYAAIGIKGIRFDEVIAQQGTIEVPAATSWITRTGLLPIYVNQAIDPANSPYDVYIKILDPLVISPPKMGAIVITDDPASQDITGRIIKVEPSSIKAGSPLEMLVKYQAFDDKALDQVNGWWTRVTVTLGGLTGWKEMVHMGRDANNVERILLGVMPSKTLTGKVRLEGTSGDMIENPLGPTPPATGWYLLEEKTITVSPGGTTTPEDNSGALGWLAAAGLGLLALAGSGSGKKPAAKSSRKR